MAINFPNSPVDGDTHNQNGIRWKYSASVGVWFVIEPPLNFANTFNGQVLFNQEDSIISSNGLVFTTASNTLSINALTATRATVGSMNVETAIVSSYDKANAANSLAYNTGLGANAFTSATVAGANTAVGGGANAFTSATIAGANTAVGAGANAYSATVGTSANAFTSATIAGANTAVGGGANSFTSATVAGANTISIAAFAKANAALPNTSGVSFAGNLYFPSGNVGIGTTSPAANLHVIGSANVTANLTVSSLGVGTTANGTAGTIRATNDITSFFSSDQRLKEDIEVIENALDKVLSLNGVTFNWKKEYIDTNGGEDGYFVRKRDVGVIAQELQKVLPEAVAERNDGILAVKYDRIVSLLIEAIKEQQKQIDVLNAKLIL